MASQKGGSGKTTLSGHLAVQAQRAGAGPVVLIDIDPQGSLADWWNEREAEYPAFAQTTGPAPARWACTAKCPERVVFPDPPFCDAKASTRNARSPWFVTL